MNYIWCVVIFGYQCNIRRRSVTHIHAWKRNIGYVPQAFALYDELSAEQNVKFFGSFSKFGYLQFNIAYQNYIPASSSVSQLLL